MNKTIEQLEKDIAEQESNLIKLKEEILIQKAIERIEIKDVKNNLLEDVRIAEYPSLTYATKSFNLMFKLNGRKFVMILQTENSCLTSDILASELSKIILKEMAALLKTGTMIYPPYF